MFVVEAISITGAGCGIGLLFFYVGMASLQPIIEYHFGLFMPIAFPTFREWLILGMVMGAATATGLIPALMAYRCSLADGMSVRH